jgi:hypothetical protein
MLTLVNITYAYSLIDRTSSHITGAIHGQPVSVLIDTGATDFNYIEKSVVNHHRLVDVKLSQHINVCSVHGSFIISSYSIVPVILSFGNSTVQMNIPCLILESSPRDVIIGLPAITQYNLLNRFRNYFETIGMELLVRQRELFPHLQTEVMACAASTSTAILPVVVDSMSPTWKANRTSSQQSCTQLQTISQTTPIVPQARVIDSMSPASHLPNTYTVVHRNELFDNFVEPDTDSMPVDEDIPDPVAVAVDCKPLLFGPLRLQQRLRKLCDRFAHIFAVELPKEPAHVTPIKFNIDAAGWKADKRTRQYVRPISHEKENLDRRRAEQRYY